MALCKKQKKVRPPLKPREGPYKKINAYTSRPSVEQILTFILAWLVVILHSIFLVKAITKIDHVVLYILLALNYALVLGLIITYVQITVFDPVDTYILNPTLAEVEHMVKNATYCHLCRSYVHQKSYHCKRCNRCTEDFDHHCVFLNNCIGSLNYELFMRLLLLYILFLFNNIAQAVWVYVVARRDSIVQQASITRWMSIVIIIISALQIIATGALLGFHCYISCCLDLTTIAFYQSDTHSNRSDSAYDLERNVKKTSNEVEQSPGPYFIKDGSGYVNYNQATNNALVGNML